MAGMKIFKCSCKVCFKNIKTHVQNSSRLSSLVAPLRYVQDFAEDTSGLVRKLSKGRFLTLRYKFGQKWYQTDRVDVSNQGVKKFVLRITLGAAGAQKTAQIW